MSDTGVVVWKYGGDGMIQSLLDIRLGDIGFVPAIHDDADSIGGNAPAFEFAAPPLRPLERQKLPRAHDERKTRALAKFLPGVTGPPPPIAHHRRLARAHLC